MLFCQNHNIFKESFECFQVFILPLSIPLDGCFQFDIMLWTNHCGGTKHILESTMSCAFFQGQTWYRLSHLFSLCNRAAGRPSPLLSQVLVIASDTGHASVLQINLCWQKSATWPSSLSSLQAMNDSLASKWFNLNAGFKVQLDQSPQPHN